ncbi:hypothetical protein D9M70_579690 [compost metagenome]
MLHRIREQSELIDQWPSEQALQVKVEVNAIPNSDDAELRISRGWCFECAIATEISQLLFKEMEEPGSV